MSFYKITIGKLKPSLTNELIFVLYLWGFMILRPVVAIFENYSALILLVFALSLILLSIHRQKKAVLNQNQFYLVIFFLSVFIFDFIFRGNNFTFRYFKDFLIYAIIPFFFLSQVQDSRKLLELFSSFSIVLLLLYFWSPFLPNYGLFANLMDYGFNLLLPGFLGVHIGRKFLKKKKWLILEPILIIMVLIFANRSVLLSIGFIYAVSYAMTHRNWYKMFIATIILAVVFHLFFAENLFIWAYETLLDYGFESNSLHKLRNLYKWDLPLDAFFSGRLAIWEDAINIISKSPIFGNGTAFYHSYRGCYVHNIVLDILLQYGFIGLSFIVCLLIHSIYRMFFYGRNEVLISLMFFAMWFPRLLFSSYMFENLGFWCFIASGFMFHSKKMHGND